MSAVTGSGTTWTIGLTPDTVHLAPTVTATGKGDVTVTINKTGIAITPVTVEIYAKPVDIIWFATGDKKSAGAKTTTITVYFWTTAGVAKELTASDLAADDISVVDGPGVVTATYVGSSAAATLDITITDVFTADLVQVVINKPGFRPATASELTPAGTTALKTAWAAVGTGPTTGQTVADITAVFVAP
jgi:hypothetical protein